MLKCLLCNGLASCTIEAHFSSPNASAVCSPHIPDCCCKSGLQPATVSGFACLASMCARSVLIQTGYAICAVVSFCAETHGRRRSKTLLQRVHSLPGQSYACQWCHAVYRGQSDTDIEQLSIEGLQTKPSSGALLKATVANEQGQKFC